MSATLETKRKNKLPRLSPQGVKLITQFNEARLEPEQSLLILGGFFTALLEAAREGLLGPITRVDLESFLGLNALAHGLRLTGSFSFLSRIPNFNVRELLISPNLFWDGRDDSIFPSEFESQRMRGNVRINAHKYTLEQSGHLNQLAGHVVGVDPRTATFLLEESLLEKGLCWRIETIDRLWQHQRLGELDASGMNNLFLLDTGKTNEKVRICRLWCDVGGLKGQEGRWVFQVHFLDSATVVVGGDSLILPRPI